MSKDTESLPPPPPPVRLRERAEYISVLTYEDSNWHQNRSLEVLCRFLKGKLLDIPKKFREAAHVIIDSDCDKVYIEISYKRPLTDEELEERAERGRAAIARKEKEDMDQLKMLSSQYGFRLVKKK